MEETLILTLHPLEECCELFWPEDGTSKPITEVWTVTMSIHINLWCERYLISTPYLGPAEKGMNA